MRQTASGTKAMQPDDDHFRSLWSAGVSLRAMAGSLCMTQEQVSRHRRRLGLPQRCGSFDAAMAAKAEPIIDPSPREIETRAADIRSRWTDRTRELRRVTKSAGGYRFPVYTTEEVFGDGEEA